MGKASFSACYLVFFLRTNRDEEIILSERISISLFDLMTRPWGVLHYNCYILPIRAIQIRAGSKRKTKRFHTLKKNSKSLAAGSKLVTFSSSAFMESWSRWTGIWVWKLIQGGWLVHTTMVIVNSVAWGYSCVYIVGRTLPNPNCDMLIYKKFQWHRP